MANINEMNHFTQAEPELKIGRSVFKEDEENKGTCASGRLVPIYCKDIYPGDTFQIGLNFVLRMLSPVVPPLDNCWLDVFAFFVPSRVLCEKYHLTINAATGEDYGDFETYLGENKSSDWAPDVETELKGFKPVSVFWYGSNLCTVCNMPQSIADYLGYAVGIGTYGTSGSYLPPSITDLYGNDIQCDQKIDYSTLDQIQKVNGLDFAAFDYIYNMKFRNPNFQAMTLILQSGDLDYSIVSSTAGMRSTQIGTLNGCFTLPYGASISGGGDTDCGYYLKDIYYPQKAADYFTSCLPEPYYSVGDISLYLGDTAPVSVDVSGALTNGNVLADGVYNGYTDSPVAVFASGSVRLGSDTDHLGTLQLNNSSFTASGTGTADLSDASAITVNELRELITIQHLAENFARCGTLYPEILLGNFGVRPSDSAIQYPELLGAHRFGINTTQVTSTTVGSGIELGTVGAYSKTVGSDDYLVSKSFTEHGRLMIIMVIRTNQAYSQGTPKRAQRLRRFEDYWPEFAHLGEQAVKTSELYAFADASDIFGYQEAWADLKTGHDSIHGFLRPEVGDLSLSPYTYQLAFESAPKLGADFMAQSSKNIGNVLYDTQTESQFLYDILFSVKAIRTMPVFSIPGVDRI